MLCNCCRTHIFSRASTSPRLLLSQSRPYSSTPSFLSSAPAPNAPSITLPSSGGTISSSTATEPSKPSSSSTPSNHVQSSCVVGTKLQGLNYVKNKPDLVALDDAEYPSWLWNLLDDGKGGKIGKADGSDGEVQMNRKQRKRYEKKLAAAEAAKPRKIPVHEQSIDITPASETANAGEDNLIDISAKGQSQRGDIRKSAREARRKGIREANFLKGL